MPRRLPVLALLLLLPLSAYAQRMSCEGGSIQVPGLSAPSDCDAVTFLGHLAITEMGGTTGGWNSTSGNDIWGWTDPETGREYALVGLSNGTSFVDVTVPESPVYLGRLPTHSENSTWRDIKVYADHAFVVSEAWSHGMQVFDLTRLRDVNISGEPLTFTEDAHYGQFGNAHNLVINEDTGFAYAVGTNQCSGGLHMVDISDPLNPSFAGCFSSDGYTHDAQCVIYAGPDTDYQGREICFTAQGSQWSSNHFGIVDVTDKTNPALITQAIYPNPGYAHQGWLTEDHRYFIANDELDEGNYGHNTRTLIFDVTDLDEPSFHNFFFHPVSSTDHNLYVKGDFVYLSNYTSGLRLLDLRPLLAGTGEPEQYGYFDTFPQSNNSQMTGTWSNYPFFASGTVIVNDIVNGLFVLEPQLPQPTGAPGTTPEATAAALSPARPNPFHTSTVLDLTVNAAQRVTVAAYDLLGRRVATLYDGTAAAGQSLELHLEAADLPAGLYLVRATGETFVETRRVTLTR